MKPSQTGVSRMILKCTIVPGALPQGFPQIAWYVLLPMGSSKDIVRVTVYLNGLSPPGDLIPPSPISTI